MNFQGKTIVLTGAASGIGAATARALAQAGARIIALDRQAASTADRFLQCELTDPDAIDRAVAAIDEPVHGLVNVAGVPGSSPVELVAKVNVLAVRRLTEALLPRIEDHGAIVNVASTAAAQWRRRLEAVKTVLSASGWRDGLEAFLAQGLDPVTAYDFSKEIVVVYSALVSSWQRHRGVRVNSVSPGAVETPILKDFYATMGDDLLGALKRQAGGRDADPSEIPGAILFLLSPQASWVNGTDLLVDGGAEAVMTLRDMARPPLGRAPRHPAA